MTRGDLAAGFTALSGFLARASNQIATVVVTLVATRYLAPAEFGVFALASIAITLIRTFLYSGAFEYLLKAPDARDCSSEALAVNLLLASGLSVLLGAVVIAGSQLFAAGAIAFAILAMLPSNIISAVTAWQEALLLRSSRLRLYYGLTTLAELAAMAVAVALLFAGYKVGALVWQVYARNAAMLLLYLLANPLTLSRHFSRTRFMAVLNWSISRYAAVLIGFGSGYSADLFLGIFLSPAATGLYRASSRIVTAVADMFGQPARTIAMTVFSARAAAGERSDTLWPVVFVVAALVGWAALAGLAAVAPLVVPIVLDEQWRAAAALVPILCVARAFSLFDGIAAAALVAYDEQRPLFYLQCIAAAFGTLLIVIAAPFGIVPATIAVVLGALAGSAMLANVALRRLPGSGSSLVAALPLLLGPVAATVAGAQACRALAVGAALGPNQIATLSIIGGVVAWGIALLLIRRRTAAMIVILRGTPTSQPLPNAPIPACLPG